MKGVFYGVGVGPGDPDLITLKGYRALQEADVICSPKPAADKEGVALAVARQLLPQPKPVLELPFPMTRDKAKLETCWNDAARRITALLEQGQKVAFVTLGDPGLYSTYTYLCRKVRQAGAYQIVTIPGVASFAACAAEARLPLAEGDEKLAIIPTVKDLQAVRAALQNFENVVLMKISRRYGELVNILKELGLHDRAVYASRCGLAGGFVKHNLTEPESEPGDYLSLLIVKKNKHGCD